MIVTHKDQTYWQGIVRTKPIVASIVNMAFSFGAFVAGGFPRVIRRGEDLNLFFTVGGDVDLFFRDKSSYDAFVNCVKQAERQNGESFLTSTSRGGMSYDIKVAHGLGRHNEAKIQAVGSHFGTPKEVLQTFDFRNIQIAFDETLFYVDDRQHVVERDNEIDIVNWDSPLLLRRVGKYMNRHKFSGLTKECRERFVTWIFDTYHTLPESGTLPGFIAMNKTTFRRSLSAILKQKNVLDDKDLVLFVSFFKEGDVGITDDDLVTYGTPWTELRDRLDPPTTQLAKIVDQKDEEEYNWGVSSNIKTTVKDSWY